MNEIEVNAECVAKNLAGPRVTPADVDAAIVGETYFTASDGVLGAYKSHNDVYQGTDVHNLAYNCLTFCVLVLRNGFTVTGESVCASPENFNEELGRKIARDNARAKIWPLMGYALRESIYKGER